MRCKTDNHPWKHLTQSNCTDCGAEQDEHSGYKHDRSCIYYPNFPRYEMHTA